MEQLPIDEHLKAILAIREKNFVLHATAGSGKTTRVPPALAGQADGRILCVEPRRLAAIAAARRTSAEAGTHVGREIGYHVRMDKNLCEQTNLLYLTTGMLLQYLCHDPMLDGVSAVIFDEFHERTLDMDTALAMVRFIQRELSPDLRIIVMSATLDPSPLTEFLALCGVFEVDAPRFPLTIEFSRTTPGPRFQDYRGMLSDALDRALRHNGGDILVFLPGMAEIQQAADDARSRYGAQYDYRICHANLPVDVQADILRPDSPGRRIVFSTNVAESSLTIPRVTCVIDTGYAKEKFFDSTSGLSRLETVRISKASADQRAGRAGRIAPGLCIRLWNAATDTQLEPCMRPQIERLDLSQALLQIYAWGLELPEKLSFLTRPHEGRVSDASQLLTRLGAIKPRQDAFELTDLGTRMARLPLEPRLARWMIAAAEYGCERDAALLATFLSEAPYRRHARDLFPGPDLERDLAILRGKLPPELAYLKKQAGELLDSLRLDKNRPSQQRPPREALACSMLAAYPDRLAETRQRTRDRQKQFSASDPERLRQPILARMTPNRGVIIPQGLTLTDARFFICADLDLVRGVERASNTVFKALPVDPSWISWKTGVVARYESDKDRVVIAEAVYYDVFTLRETFLHDPRHARLERKTLLDAAMQAPARALNLNGDAVRALIARMEFVKKIEPSFEYTPVDEEFAKYILPDLVDRAHNFEELHAIDLCPLILSSLDDMGRATLDALAPEKVKLENGRLCSVDYQNDPPIVRVRIQHAFDTWRVPCVGSGKVPVLMHLCAPNDRTVQVTQDMKSFWTNGYPELRKVLRGRYPKHDWHEIVPK